jgi:hypothetical protein
MNCKETIRLMCDYLEGKLTANDALALRRHFGQCKNCRLVLQGAQNTLDIYFDGEYGVPSLHKSQVA